VNIRRATSDDLDFLVRVDLEDEGISSNLSDGWDADQFREHRRKIANFISNEGALVADSEDAKQIGTILWRFRELNEPAIESTFLEIRDELPPDGKFCEIFQLWVDANHRRQGLATRLKTLVEAEAAERGVRAIYTHTEATNHHVIDLNLKLGYREVRRGPIWDEVVRVSLVKDLRLLN